ncbi:hypothetical protein CLV72_10913 [Allonocardiopsis opalescens]|uniref:Uncharacterized protein n=1 Tax=Allonocardiopsis opalescens TaxID=1144618 RepID=A0A2T0PV42_9ACTN|nr:hypothetical protein CLV72_10913 [Allonocardiopsis opalescens]
MEYIDFPAVPARFGCAPSGAAQPLDGGEDNRKVRMAPDRGEVVVRECLRSGADKVMAAWWSSWGAATSPHPCPSSPAAASRHCLKAGTVAVFPFVSGGVPPSGAVRRRPGCTCSRRAGSTIGSG